MDRAHPFETFRRKHGFTQEQLAERLRISQARVSHYVTGRNELPIAVAHDFVRLARELGDEYTLEDIYPADSAA